MTDYAILIMGVLYSNTNKIFSSNEIAIHTNLNQATVAKLVKILSANNFIKTIRGINGGCVLLKTPNEIRLVDIIQAIEGPIALTSCVEGVDQSCAVRNSCFMNGNWNKINNVIYKALAKINLNELYEPSFTFPLQKENNYNHSKDIQE